jgi:FAD/FMN-containing dehydrogenase
LDGGIRQFTVVSASPPEYDSGVATILEPDNLRTLGEQLAAANARRERIASVNLKSLTRVLEHAPEDMTVTVEAGIPLATLQAHLAKSGQWLPLDPPHPERLTIGDLLATNAAGPLRCGFGTARDWLIGLRVALADGTIIKSGGKVVKNVAGYDLAKLFIGGGGSLGVIVEAGFKLRPLPERTAFAQRPSARIGEACGFVEAVAASRLDPVVFDLHNISGTDDGHFTTVLGFAGATEDVDAALETASALGAVPVETPGYERFFWDHETAGPVQRLSFLPSRLEAALKPLGDAPFVARAANGLVHWRGGPRPPEPEYPRHLCERIKAAFDPNGVFPELLP